MGPSVRNSGGAIQPTLGDILRLWVSLHTEFGKTLSIEVEPLPGENGVRSLCLSVCSVENLEGMDGGARHVWAQMFLYDKNYAISFTRLFDLLIHAHYSLREENEKHML